MTGDDFRSEYRADLQYLTDLKTALIHLKAEKGKVETESGKWKNRIELALAGGRRDLAEKAEEMVTRTDIQLTGLKTEETRLLNQIALVRKNVQAGAVKQNMTTDAAALLTELETLAGPADMLKVNALKMEAEQELMELKKRLGKTDLENSG